MGFVDGHRPYVQTLIVSESIKIHGVLTTSCVRDCSTNVITFARVCEDFKLSPGLCRLTKAIYLQSLIVSESIKIY